MKKNAIEKLATPSRPPKDVILPVDMAMQPNKAKLELMKKEGYPAPIADQGAAILAGIATSYEPVPEELDQLDRLATNNPRRLRGGSSTGVKPMIRRLMGTPIVSDVHSVPLFPKYTVEEICRLTGKGEVNVRTCLTDLRTKSYCGVGGPFVTESFREGPHTFYRYSPALTSAVKTA